MNIGDGLLFELEHGKPKLTLLNRGAEKRPAKPLSLRPRPSNLLSSRQPSCAKEVQGDEGPAQQQAGRHREIRSKTEGDASSAHSSIPITQTEGRKTKRHDQSRQDRVKLKTNKRCAAVRQKEGGTDEKEVLADGGLKDHTAALSNDQLQRILSTFQTSCGDKEGNETGPKSRCSEPMQRGEEGKEKAIETETTVNSQENISRASGCTFSWLEERLPHSKAASGAKKAQWRRDLDEQVEEKEHHSAHVRLQNQGGSTSRTEQHAAIRSSLRIGDVSPIEMEQNMEKKEEQRRHWLQELDCQRQEMMERRRREKLLRNQMEDRERWMAHFDSFQKRTPARAGAPLAEVQPCRAEQGGWEPSSSLSLAWDASNSCGADSLVGASVDSTSRCQTRSSYLRTMTSLLDPAQIEERERRRVKQLVQQTAIEAQMEERRKLREEEEAKTREEEEREEKRLGREREMLQRQYELETRKEKEQPDAGLHAISLQPDAGLHAISLQPDAGLHAISLQPDVGLHAISLQPDVGLHAISLQTFGGHKREAGSEDAGASSLRDTAIQTETTGSVQTLDVAVQYHPPPPRSTAPPNSRTAGKENLGEPAGDLYEPFARTERGRGGKRRPEWNTQRPSRRFVPASERYPPNLQRDRQRNRLKRQAELLALQERARPLKPELPSPHSQEPHLCSTSQLGRTSTPPCRKVETESRERSGSVFRPDRCWQPPHSPPPDLVPYVRTNEVRLDHLQLADTPPPHTNPGAPAHLRVPLTHTRRRQQQILRGLAQLRQGLLQKRKELEMDLNTPPPRTASASHSIL
ncbi:Coiled-coil domain-containing protein 66 [Oryzias melastigma]|uniref:Coiled-coil domain-containing protein 66 n=1 Tax=Oryzias melastigma TaxID=30732 RepID=A0A834C8S6_ORYME|nr:Coiled-coil domain-containing protein 66 [Oryzias melastigma]